MEESLIRSWAEEYLSIEETKRMLEARQQEIKDKLRSQIPTPDFADPASRRQWVAGAAEVVWCKGKKASETIDRSILVREGVTPDIIEKAIVKGKEGSPSLRIGKAPVSQELAGVTDGQREGTAILA